VAWGWYTKPPWLSEAAPPPTPARYIDRLDGVHNHQGRLRLLGLLHRLSTGDVKGLGPGDPLLLTRQAWELLESIDEIYLRTRQHPVVADFPSNLMVHSFDVRTSKAKTLRLFIRASSSR
jgi:hypothetical protein